MHATIQSIDWTNAVIIPAVLTVLLGGWVGLVCTRLMIFYQARYKAATDIMQALPNMRDAEDVSGMVFALVSALNPSMQEFASLGHTKAWRAINLLARRCHSKAAEICGAQIPRNGPPSLPDLKGEAFLSFRNAYISQFYIGHLNTASAGLSQLRPNWSALLTPNPLPLYKHSSDLAREMDPVP